MDYRHVAPLSAAGDLTWNIRDDECRQRELCTFDKYKFAVCRARVRIAELHFAMNITGDNLRTGKLTV